MDKFICSNQPNEIGKGIRRARKSAGMNRGQLASLVGLRACDIAMLERGFGEPCLTQLIDLATALNSFIVIEPMKKREPENLCLNIVIGGNVNGEDIHIGDANKPTQQTQGGDHE